MDGEWLFCDYLNTLNIWRILIVKHMYIHERFVWPFYATVFRRDVMWYDAVRLPTRLSGR